MSEIDRVVAHAERVQEQVAAAGMSPRPERHIAVVACMDARLDLFTILGLEPGDAHLIRNAGGVVTDDVLRSLVISQRRLGTREVVLVHHTGCGMLTITDDEVRKELAAETGQKPSWAVGSFTDLEEDLRSSMVHVRECPFLPYRETVRGFIFDVETGELREVGFSD
jgi:carbonic anhydrase